MIRVAFFAALLLATPAEAEQPHYCTPPAELKGSIEYCESNFYYAEAADACLKRFDREIQAAQVSLGKSFRKNDKKSAAKQDAKFANNGVNLTQTSASLAVLIADGERLREDLLAYEKALLYPGNPTPEMIQQYKLDEFFATTPCFAGYKEMLVKKRARLEGWIGDLRLANGTARRLDGVTDERQGNLSASAGGQKLLKRGLSSSGPRKRPKQKASTITGEIKKEPAR